MPESRVCETASIRGALACGSYCRVLPAVLHKLVDQQRVLTKMQMDVAGQEIRPHETLVTDHFAIRIEHLVGRFEVTVVAGDPAPMELMPAVELAAWRQDAVLERQQLTVAEAVNLSIHGDVHRNYPCHLVSRAGLRTK